MNKKTMKKLGILGIILGGVMLLLCIGCFAAWYFLPTTWGALIPGVSSYYGIDRSTIIEAIELPGMFGVDLTESLGVGYTIFKIASIARWIFLGLGVLLLGAGILFMILGKGASSAKAAPAPAKAAKAPAKAAAPKREWRRCPSCGTACAPSATFCPTCGTKFDAAPAPASASAAAGTKCPKCGHDCPAGVQFCPECGSRLTAPAAEKPAVSDLLICAVCGTENPLEARYCRGCGKSLASATLSGSTPAPRAEEEELFKRPAPAPETDPYDDVTKAFAPREDEKELYGRPAPAAYDDAAKTAEPAEEIVFTKPAAEAPAAEAESAPVASRIRTSLRTTSEPDEEKPVEEKPKFSENPFMSTPSDL